MSVNFTERAFGPGYDTKNGILKQKICMFNPPNKGSANIENFVKTNIAPSIPGIDWHYQGGSAVLHLNVPVAHRKTTEELNAIESEIRALGIRTFAGALPEMA